MESLRTFAFWLESTRLSDSMIYPWVWPTVEAFHFLGLTLLLGTIMLFDLRLLGVAKRLPAGPLHQMVPWGIAGFCISLISGTLLFVGMAVTYVDNLMFQLKLLALLLAGVNVLLFYLTVSRKALALGPGQDAPLLAKTIAGSSLFLWFAVICFGRYIALY